MTILEAIEPHVKLTPKFVTLKGICPINKNKGAEHDFFVRPLEDVFYCLECHISGIAENFIEEYKAKQ